MELGVVSGWARGPDEQFIKIAGLAEESGFDFFGIADSQSVIRELYSCLTLIAHTTDSISTGSMVTNFVTRHPVVTASGMTTLADISDERVIMGVGSGDSAVHTIGESPLNLEGMEQEIRDFKRLTSGERITRNETDIQLAWNQNRRGAPDIPVFLAAEGPKTQQLAGKVADGVIIGTGLSPDIIRSSIDRVNASARDVGRDPDEIEKWVLARANVGEDKGAVRDELKASVAAVANHSLKYTFEGKHVPEEYRDKIRTLQKRYKSHSHGQPHEHNQQVIEDLGLTEYLMDRYAVAGTPDACTKKLQSIQDVSGVDGTMMVMGPVDPDRQQKFLMTMGQEVLPRLES